jgi:hypothetical protein
LVNLRSGRFDLVQEEIRKRFDFSKTLTMKS